MVERAIWHIRFCIIGIETILNRRSEMKLFRMVMFGILGIVCAAVPSNAQNTSKCYVDGPGIQETINYVVSKAGGEIGYDLQSGQVWWSRPGEPKNGFSADDELRFEAPIMRLDCTYHPRSDDKVGAGCGVGGACVICRYRDSQSPWYPCGTPYTGLFYSLSMDTPDLSKDEVTAVNRAWNHLVYLLQTAYKAQHTDPNDPFANPK